MSRVDNTGGSGFTVDNGTGLVVRTKLNQIIAALSTLNQGSGDPSIGVAAYVPHIDGNTLKIRNAANDAFISLGDVSATNFGHASLSASNTFAGGCTFSSTATLNGTTTLAGTNTISGATTFTEDVTFDGATAGRDVVFDRSDNALEFADDAKAVFGAGSDLTIQSDGSNSLILSDLLFINNAANSENMLKLTANGSVELFENNTKTFETEDSGVRVIGHAGADVTALSDASTITVDFKTGTHFSVTLGGNRTFDRNNTADSIGSSGSIFIIQDGTGSRTASFQSSYKFAGGTAPTLSTAANAVDRLDYIVRAFNDIHCVVTLDVK